MLKRKWYLFPVIALFVIGVIFGSFFDLQINQGLYDPNNGFGLFMAAFGEMPVYGFMGILGFGFYFLTKTYKKAWQILLLVLGIIATIGVCVYFQGHHIFDINAYNNKSLSYIGYIIALFIYLIGLLLGYFLFRKSEVKPLQILIVLLTIAIIMGISVGINQLLKSVMARPRFRFIYRMLDVEGFYRNWWENGKSLKAEYVGFPWVDDPTVKITSEEFKSFPSGHLSNTMNLLPMLLALPLLNNKFKLKEEWLILIAIIWNLLLAYTRMRVGAHYLSDVSFGSLITILVTLGVNELYELTSKKLLVNQEENIAQ